VRVRAIIVLCLAVAGCPASPSHSIDGGPSRDGGRDAGGDGGAASAAPDAGPADEILPPSSSEEMTARARHLLEAIAHDSPELATDMVFPRDAYLLTRDSTDPGKAWDAKVTSAFQRNVHVLHKRAHGVEKAQFVSFELGKSVQQATPKKREWKRSLWRVKHSRITFTIDGRTQRIEIAEMTGWHGAWYVTKLR
jgi:hypothetical protein